MPDKRLETPASPASVPQETLYFEPAEEITLIDLIIVLWKHRLKIFVLTGIFACLVGLFIVFKFFPKGNSITRLKFKLDFIGADKNEYPNGLKFSPADIMVPLVLEPVYNKNAIDQYKMTPAQFRDSLMVTKSHDGLIYLEEKYDALLNGKKDLSSEERKNLQQEYKLAKDKLLNHTQYYISIDDRGSRIPQEIQSKILVDVLNEWATFSEKKRGVYQYQIPLLTSDLFDYDLKEEEYIVQVDMLRILTQRISNQLEQILNLPGALLARSDNGISLPVLRVRMEDLIRYKIEPLSGLVRRGRLYKNQRLATIYLKEQLYTLELNKKEQQGVMALLKDSLDGYINSDDKIIVAQGQLYLKTQREISYYKDMLPDQEGTSNVISKNDYDALLKIFKRKFDGAQKEGSLLTDEMNSLYSGICRNNLRPEQSLYSTARMPEFKNLNTVPTKKLSILGGGTVLLFFSILCLIILMMERMHKISTR